VANYNANINITVAGASRLNAVTASVERLNNLSQNLKPLNLLAPGGGKLGDSIRLAIKPINDFARSVQNGNKQVSNTFAGAVQQANVFRTVLENVKVAAGGYEKQSASVKLYASALAQAEKQATRLSAAQNDLARTAKGLQPQTERDLEYYRRVNAIQSGRLRQQRELAAAEFMQQKRAEDFERRLGIIRERNAAREKQQARTREATSNAIIGGAFPLLFGQGLGASVGGGLGGFAGGAAGGQLGFGLSLVGTALGSSFDQAIQSAKDFSLSLREGGNAAGYLEQQLGYLDPTVKKQIQNLQASGQIAKAAEVAFNELAKQVGVENAAAFKQLGDDTLVFTTGFQRLVTTIIAGAARIDDALKPVRGQLQTLLNAVPGVNALSITRGAADFIRGFGQQPSADTNAQTNAARQRTSELARSNDLLRLQVQLTAVSAKGDLDRFITLQKQTAQKEYENELTKLSIQLKNGELDIAEKEQLVRGANLRLSIQLGEIERSRVEEIRRRTEEAQQAAKQAADQENQRRIKQLTLQGSILNTFTDQTKAHIELISFLDGEEAGLNAQLKVQRQLNEQRLIALDKEAQIAVLGAETAAEEKLINDLYNRRINLLERQNYIEELRARRRKNEIFFERFGLVDAVTTTSKRTGESAFGNAPGAAGGAGAFRTDINLMPGLTNGVIGEQFALLKTELEELVKVENQVIQAAKSIGDAFGTSLKGVITGTMTAQEALANFFQSVADHFADMAAQMISKWLQMQILGLAQSLLPGGSTIFPRGVDNFSGAFGAGGPTFQLGAFGGARAAGGPVASGSTYMVGERGPELFVPRSSGTIVPNHALSGTTNVVVNVDASGSTVQGDSPNANQMGRVIGAAVQAEIVKMQRPGGLLAGTR
jgi:hypothetical protein